MHRYTPLNASFANLTPLAAHLPDAQREAVEFSADMTWMRHAAATIMSHRHPATAALSAEADTIAATGITDIDIWPYDWAGIRITAWKKGHPQ